MLLTDWLTDRLTGCCSIYIMGLVFEWIQQQGGVKEMERTAIVKSTAVYDLINSSQGFYVYVICFISLVVKVSAQRVEDP